MIYLLIYFIGLVMSFLILEKVFKEELRNKNFKTETYMMIFITSLFSWAYIALYFLYSLLLKDREIT